VRALPPSPIRSTWVPLGAGRAPNWGKKLKREGKRNNRPDPTNMPNGKQAGQTAEKFYFENPCTGFWSPKLFRQLTWPAPYFPPTGGKTVHCQLPEILWGPSEWIFGAVQFAGIGPPKVPRCPSDPPRPPKPGKTYFSAWQFWAFRNGRHIYAHCLP